MILLATTNCYTRNILARYRRATLAALLIGTALTVHAVAQTLPDTHPPKVFAAPQVPADWQLKRVNGIDLRLPSDLVVIRDGRDDHVWGEGDEKSREGFGLGIALSDTPERDMKREGAKPDGFSLVLPNGQVFHRYTAVAPPEAGVKGEMEALVSDLPMQGEDRLIVSVMVMERDLDDYRKIFEQFLGGLALPPAGGQLQRDFLRGVVRMPVGPGWSGARDIDADELYMFTDALEGSIQMNRGTVNTGSMRKGTPGKAVLFMGQKAQFFSHEDGSQTKDDGTGDSGQARLIVLETCLPDGAAITLRFAGMPELFHAPDVAAMVAGGAIVLPEGSVPCAPGMLPEGSDLAATDPRTEIAPPFEVAAPSQVQPRASGQALGGLYTYRLPIGWIATPEPGDKRIRFANADGSVTITLARGSELTAPDGPAALVPPGTFHRSAIAFGWPATKYDWPVTEDQAVLNRLMIHDHCLSGNERFGMLVTAPKAYLDNDELSKALREVDLNMPDDIVACTDPSEGIGEAQAPPVAAPKQGDPLLTLAPTEKSQPKVTPSPAGSTDQPAAVGAESWFGQPPQATQPSPATESLAGRWQGAVLGGQGGEVTPPQPAQPVQTEPAQTTTAPPAPPALPQPPVPPAAEPDSFTTMEGGYALYRNQRYGTSILFPETYFRPALAPDSGDGRLFQSVDGTATFYVFAQYNAEGLSQSQQISRDKSDPTHANVSYERAGPGWYVLSGMTDGRIFYRRVIEDTDGLIRVFEIRYPAARKTEFDAVVAYMANSFGHGADLAGNQPSAGEQPSANVTEPQVSDLSSVAENTLERAEGWWIIVGTFPTEPWQRQKTDFERMQSMAASCDLQLFNDFSGKFRGFRPGYNVFVVGAFESKSTANNRLQQVRQCFPDAYVKYGEHLGE